MPAGADRPTALDSSVAIPLLVHTHDDHPLVEAWARRRSLVLTSHSLAETYSVLTRLPDGIRVSPEDAVLLLRRGFAAPLLIKPKTARDLAAVLAAHGIAGGAVYDALVGLAVIGSGGMLATRDARALGTYQALGVEVEVVS